jgi:raffinose/stachyose/melibiose transport system permease protein
MTDLMTESPRAGGARRDPSPQRPSLAPMERQHRRVFWPFAAPALLTYTAVFLVPIGYAAWTSLYKWDGMGPKQWRGLKNYRILFHDPFFRSSLTNTLEILFVGGACTFAISFALTLVLREMRGRFFARSVIFFPCLVNAMVFGVLAGFLFSPNGPVNQILHGLGLSTPPKWLSTDNLFPMIVGTLVWTATGYYTAIIMAAVDQIPPYLYEAAELDGANAFQRFWHITLPLAWDVISVCAVLWTVSSVKIFELILVYGGSNTGHAPPAQSWNTAMYVYEEAFPPQSPPALGMATAAALVSLVMVGMFTVVLRRVMRRKAFEV